MLAGQPLTTAVDERPATAPAASQRTVSVGPVRDVRDTDAAIEVCRLSRTRRTLCRRGVEDTTDALGSAVSDS